MIWFFRGSGRLSQSMQWLFIGSRQILELKHPRCCSRYSEAERYVFATMDTDNSVFTDTTHDILPHFCSNLSSLSLTLSLSSPRCFLPPSAPQALEHRQLIPAWQARSPAPSPVYSSKPAWSYKCCPSLLPCNISTHLFELFSKPHSFIQLYFSSFYDILLSPEKCFQSLYMLQI